jgi:hypothetical protein
MRHRHRYLAALLTLAIAGCAGPASPGRPPTHGTRSGVTGGTLFGGDLPLVSEEGALGRKLAIVRTYYRLGESFPRPADRRVMEGGGTLLVSLDALPGGASYSSIAAGAADAGIARFLRAMEQAAVTYHLGAVYFCFEHEADTRAHAGLGTPAQFVQAWDHIHQLATSMHLTWARGGRLHFAWLITWLGFRDGAASQYWPGGNETDVIATDGYNTADCRSAGGGDLVATGTQMKTPADLFGAALSFAHAHGGLPVFIAEWASVPYASAALQPDFIHLMQTYVTGNPEIAAALYWDSHGQGNGCDYEINNRPPALTALTAMGHAPRLQGRVTPAG